MHSLPLSGLPRATHGDGADRGDGGIASDSDDGGAASHSFAPSSASDWVLVPGDFDNCDEHEDFVLRPRWDDDTTCSDGCWKIQTRGGGDAEKDDRDSRYVGTYGLLSANWGGKYSDEGLQADMLRNMKSSPCQIFCLQEAAGDLLDELGKAPAQRAIRDGGDGNKDVKGERQPGSKFIGVCGPEQLASLMICGRVSLVIGIRLLVFHRLFDGMYKVPGRKSPVALAVV